MQITGLSVQERDWQELTNSTWDHEADVVVVGTGAAGLTAALAAHGAGASVLAVEKASEVGGTTLKADGGFWVPNNALMREQGLVDDREGAIRYMARLGFSSNFNAEAVHYGLAERQLSLLQAFYDYGSVAVDALVEMGALRHTMLPDPALEGEFFPDYFAMLPENQAPRGRCLLPVNEDGSFPIGRGGAELVNQLESAARHRDIPILTEHRIVALVQAPDGTVLGVKALQAQGETVWIGAHNGVVFATGGFTHNPELCATYLRGPIFGGCAAPTAEGDFVKIGSAAGAQLGNMTNAWWGEVVLEDALVSRSVPQALWITPGDSVIQVNCRGVRVMNEKRVYNERTQVHFIWDPARGEYSNLLTFMIFDQRAADAYSGSEMSYPISKSKSLTDNLISAPTLEGLADSIRERLETLRPQIGGIALDDDFVDNLQATISRFNGFAESGIDEDFGRGIEPIEQTFHHYVAFPERIQHDKPNDTMYPLSPEGPYYAVIIAPGVLDTKGGPAINSRAQILDSAGNAIVGLFGAGNCISSPAGQGYWGGGSTLGPAITFGYIAGQEAATPSRLNEAIIDGRASMSGNPG